MNTIRHELRELKVLQGPFLPFVLEEAPEEPIALFLRWFGVALAHQVPEPHAMTLSTADTSGFPDARMLILKDVDETGFHFAINAASRKGLHLEHRKQAALTFYWPKLARQVRVRGDVVQLGSEVSAFDFLARPPGSKATAFLGKQSRVLSSADDLDQAMARALLHVEANPEAVYEHWRVYAVCPDEVEFWQGASNRQHKRLRYRRDGSRYHREQLWP